MSTPPTSPSDVATPKSRDWWLRLWPVLLGCLPLVLVLHAIDEPERVVEQRLVARVLEGGRPASDAVVELMLHQAESTLVLFADEQGEVWLPENLALGRQTCRAVVAAPGACARDLEPVELRIGETATVELEPVAVAVLLPVNGGWAGGISQWRNDPYATMYATVPRRDDVRPVARAFAQDVREIGANAWTRRALELAGLDPLVDLEAAFVFALQGPAAGVESIEFTVEFQRLGAASARLTLAARPLARGGAVERWSVPVELVGAGDELPAFSAGALRDQRVEVIPRAAPTPVGTLRIAGLAADGGVGPWSIELLGLGRRTSRWVEASGDTLELTDVAVGSYALVAVDHGRVDEEARLALFTSHADDGSHFPALWRTTVDPYELLMALQRASLDADGAELAHDDLSFVAVDVREGEVTIADRRLGTR